MKNTQLFPRHFLANNSKEQAMPIRYAKRKKGGKIILKENESVWNEKSKKGLKV